MTGGPTLPLGLVEVVPGRLDALACRAAADLPADALHDVAEDAHAGSSLGDRFGRVTNLRGGGVRNRARGVDRNAHLRLAVALEADDAVGCEICGVCQVKGDDFSAQLSRWRMCKILHFPGCVSAKVGHSVVRRS